MVSVSGPGRGGRYNEVIAISLARTTPDFLNGNTETQPDIPLPAASPTDPPAPATEPPAEATVSAYRMRDARDYTTDTALDHRTERDQRTGQRLRDQTLGLVELPTFFIQVSLVTVQVSGTELMILSGLRKF